MSEKKKEEKEKEEEKEFLLLRPEPDQVGKVQPLPSVSRVGSCVGVGACNLIMLIYVLLC